MADENKKINWNKVIKLALILFIITAIASLALALTNVVTKDIIARQKQQANETAKKYVLDEADSFKSLDNVEAIAQQADPENAQLVTEISEGIKDGKTIGYVIKTVPSGYGGEIEILTGIRPDGMINGVTILSLKETAGLGARATEDGFIMQYLELNTAMDIKVIKNGETGENEINAITGATVTSKAVTKGVNLACDVFQVLKGGTQ